MVRWFSRSLSNRNTKNRKTASRRPQRLGRSLWVTNLEDRLAPAVITVTDIGDTVAVDGLVTLREALQSANGDANINADVIGVGAYGVDTIQFDSVLFSTPQLIANTAEQLVSDSVAIVGTSAGNVTIDGATINRVFHVEKAGSQIVVSFKNMTIQNGKAVSTLTGGADGGGIYNHDENVTIDSCVIDNNQADEGGGVTQNAAGGSLTILNSTISNNKTILALGDGAGINVEAAGTLNVQNSIITGGNAIGQGGGFYSVSAVNAIFTNTMITNNIANAALFAGAGIYFAGTTGNSSLTLSGCTVSGNTNGGSTGDGAGIAVAGAANLMTIFNMSTTTVDNNSTLRNGGGIAVGGFVQTTITDSTISSNKSLTAGGGGISISGTAIGTGFNLRNSTVSGNSATTDGGGIRIAVAFGNINIQNSTITNNSAIANGGGILAFAGRHTLTLQSSVVAGNFAASSNDLNSNLPVNIGNSAIGSFGSYAMNDLGGNLAVGAALNLGALNTNGGPTLTHLPGAGSPLRNIGANPAALPNDQRGSGFPRVVGTGTDIGSVESADGTSAPTAFAKLPTQTTAGGSTYTVSVVYTDDVAIDLTSIGVGDVSLSGSGVSSPSPISVSTIGSGTTVTANYLFNAPDNVGTGAWDVSDNGVFTVALNVGEVTDTSANAVLDGNVGQFLSAITQTFVVTTDAGSGPGSLTQAIFDANTSPDTNDKITFDGSLSGKTILLGGELLITDAVTIVGLGSKVLTVNGGKAGRIFHTQSAGIASLTLSGMTLTDAKRTGAAAADRGGAIFSEDDAVSLTDVIITGNTSENDGAGVALAGGNTLTIIDSIISNNTTTGTFGDAGGVFANNGPTVLIQNSTVSGNSSFFSGAGVYFVNGKVTIDSSTISGNTSSGATQTYSGGGGVYFVGSFNDILISNTTISNNLANFNGGGILFRSSGSVYNSFKIQNSTITSNRSLAPSASPGSTSGGGIAITGVVFTDINLESSIVAGNIGNLPDFSQSGALNTKNSAIGSKTGAAGTFNDLGGNLIGATLTLGTLASNGGATQTHLPGAGSVLINAGTNPGSLLFDQRGTGFSRTDGGIADIGAVDSNGLNPVSIAGPFADVTTVGGASYDFTVTYVDDTAIMVSTVDANDIVVTGPGGFSVGATVKVAPPGGDGTPRTATYTFTPPGGTWNGADNGIYTISIKSGQVSDTGATFVGGGTLGSFRVNTPLSLVVNATNDETTDTDTKLSLREAILAANAVAGLDVITFDPTVFNGSSTIALTLGAIQINNDVTITGLGPANVVIDAAGNSSKRIFRITNVVTGSHVTAKFSGMTLQNAANTETLDGTTRGGAVLIVDEFVTFTNCVFNNNRTVAGGGAIAVNGSGGSLTLIGCTFTNNKNTGVDTFAGGAIRTTTTVNLVVDGCTFTNNAAEINSGGAIATISGDLLVTNSTFSGNMAGNVAGTVNSFGGAIMFGGAPGQFGWTIRNSTFTGNKSGGRGGAIMNNGSVISGGQVGGVLTIQNSTITGNESNAFGVGGGAGGGISSQYGGAIIELESTIVSGNNNLGLAAASDIGTVANGLLGAKFSAIGVLTNIAAGTYFDRGNNLIGANLDLQPLASNGGLTQTIALGPLSAAIDNGSNPFGFTTDQRGTGFNRTVGTRTDIGAFEVQTAADLPTAAVTLPAEVTVGGATTFDVVVTYTDKTGVDGTTIDVNDITVKGGFFGLTPVSPTGVLTSGSGSSITATYTFAAPNGVFANDTNGVYTVTLKAGQVTDTSANAVTVADLDFGNFRSAIGKTITVKNGADAGADSLRQAILDANASLGVDTITFDPTVFPGVTNTVSITGAELAITDGLVIQGISSASTKVARTAGALRVFRVMGQGQFPVTFDNLTISGGAIATGAGILFFDENVTVSNSVITGNLTGGGIFIQEGGNLTVTNSTISNNSTASFGGGIAVNRNTSNVVVQNSTISGNTSTGSGAGIYHNYGGSLLVTGTTFTGNVANGTNGGGGIGFGNRINGAGFIVRNSTFTGNTALNHGGAIVFTSSLQGTAFIQNSTISKNSAPNGSAAQGNSGGGVAWRLSVGGALSNFAQINFDSTIVAGNTGNNPDISTQNLVVANKSLIGVADTGFVLTGAGNLTGTKVSPLDPLLDVLASNGGPTQTMALKAGSPAINAGSNVAALTTDQRGVGFVRVTSGTADIGAFEIQAVSATVTGVGINSKLLTPVDKAQRSYVSDVAITFSSIVTFTGTPEAAFTLDKVGGGSVTLAASVDNTGPGTVVTLTFIGGSVNSTSLADGRYALHVLSAGITGGLAGGDFIFDQAASPAPLDAAKIFRIFGDYTGDGNVAANDFIQFRLALGNSSPPFQLFDFDNDGAVAASDFIQFRLRFGGSI